MKTIICWLISCIKYPFVILFFVLLGSMERYSIYFQTHEEQATALLVLSCLVAAIPAIATAIYTFINYDEVISAGVARWTSQIEFFEGQLKYSLGIMLTSGAFWAASLFMSLQFIAPDANYAFIFGHHSNVTSNVAKNADDNSIEKTDYDWLSQRRATEDDLAGKGKKELRIMRNYIFARHGMIFKSKSLKKYFKQFDWYSPTRKDVTSDMSQIELDNVRFIKSYERKL